MPQAVRDYSTTTPPIWNPAHPFWVKVRNSRVAQNTVSMLAGNAATLIIQGLYFVLVARSLGPGQYGGFVGAISLIAVLGPFSTMGMGGILVRNVARQKELFSQSWGNAICVTCVSGSVLLVVALLLARLILSNKIPLTVFLLVGLSDLILAGVVSVAGQAYQAFEMLGGMARINVVLSAVRAGGALLLFIWIRHPDVVSWSILYLATTAISGTYAFFRVSRHLGYPRLALSSLRADALDGFYFSVSLSSQSIYNNIDKTMLVRLATLEAAGIYATAYRVLDVTFQPILSLLYSTYAKFFQHGSKGIQNTTRYARRLLPYALGYGVVAAICMIVVAPLLPIVIGRPFLDASEALRWLSPVLLFKVVHYLFSNALTGADLQGLRSSIQVAVAIFNVGLNYWLIPAYSWRGAAWASLASDGLLAIIVYAVTLVLVARANSSGTNTSESASSSA